MRRKISWRRVTALVLVLAALAAGMSGFFYLKSRQHILAERFRAYLVSSLSKAFDLQVEIGSVTGDPRGTVAIHDIRVLVPREEEEPLAVFSCGEVRFRYTLLDFFRESFTSWFDVILERPVFYANVPFGAQAPEGRSFELFSGITQKVRATSRLIIRDGTIAWLGKEGDLSGIEGVIANRSFDLSVTLNHIPLGQFDTTTTLRVEGRIIGESGSKAARLTGSAVTQGTVINWKPIPKESVVNFELSQDQLRLWDTEVFGGISIEGFIGHTTRKDLDLTLSTKDYPLQEMHDIMSFAGTQAVGGRMTSRLRMQGAITEPRMAGELVIENNSAPGARFRAMQLFFEGIYPQMKISRSQMILNNGNPMQFASDQEIHLREMFTSETYERLIASSDQRTVTWKNWTLYRDGDKDTVLLEHALSPFERPAPDHGSDEASDEPPSLETLLSGQDSLRMELKDDEQMFTLQKKAQF